MKSSKNANSKRPNFPPDFDPLVYGKVEPNAKELEGAVLGAIMLEKGAFDAVSKVLKPDSFYVEANRLIYGAMIELAKRSQPIDILTVSEQLRADDKLESVGGMFYIAQLTNAVVSSANIEAHAEIIQRKHLLRQQIRIYSQAIHECFDPGADGMDLLDQTGGKIMELSVQSQRGEVTSIGDELIRTVQKIEELRISGDDVTGVTSGFVSVDKVTTGWQAPDLIILAARPSVGKCLGKGTKVIMWDGSLKMVEDIKVGDMLMGDDSTPRRVMSLARGREQMYWVKQVSGYNYRVNESHILSIMATGTGNTHGEIYDIPLTEYLSKSAKFRKRHKGYKVEIDFPTLYTGIDPYVLGVWLGDGSAAKTEITNTDMEVIEYLYEYANREGFSVTKCENKGRCTSYHIIGGFKKLLQEYNLIRNKHIPSNFLTTGKAQRLALLAGLIDTDGYLIPTGGYEITQKNENLARQIKYLADTLGFRTSIKTKRATINKVDKGEYFKVCIFGNICDIPVKVNRKKWEKKRVARNWKISGLTIEKDIVDDYYGFVIDGNHRFLLEDCTVTHNTALALCLARNAALNKKKPVSVALFSMEMNKQQITQRLLSAESEIYLERIRKGKLEEHDMKKLYVTGIQPLSNARILMDETGALNIFELRAKCRQLKASDDIGLIIIDYLQLMSGVGDGRPQNREQEIAGISRGLKALAKELNVPIIALSQLSREADGVVPSLKMLRESGSIEQDADVVCFITRESYQKVEEEVDPALRHTVTLHFRKNRQGTLDDVPLYAVMEIQKFMEEEAYNKYQRRTDPMPASYIPISEATGPKLYIMPPTGTDGDGPF